MLYVLSQDETARLSSVRVFHRVKYRCAAGVKPLGGDLAKFTASAPVTNVIGYPSFFGHGRGGQAPDVGEQPQRRLPTCGPGLCVSRDGGVGEKLAKGVKGRGKFSP